MIAAYFAKHSFYLLPSLCVTVSPQNKFTVSFDWLFFGVYFAL